MHEVKIWLASILGFILFGNVAAQNDLVEFDNNCGNCTVSNGLGFNSFTDDCSCFWTCVLKRSVKVMPGARNDWVSYKKCCPCDQTWSQKLLTCVYFGNKQSDCFRGSDAQIKITCLANAFDVPGTSLYTPFTLTLQNPCFGEAPGTFIERTDPDVIGGALCNGYVECLLIGDKVVPRPNCCPMDECFDPASSGPIPCSTAACTGDCIGSADCDCMKEPVPKKECPFMAVPDNVTLFMGVELMATYSCAPGTCWSDLHCTCVQINNTANTGCNLWLELNFDDGMIKAANGFLWIKSEGAMIASPGADGTPFYAQFDGDGDYINTVALANAYIGNTFVFRFFFQLQNNNGPPVDDELQTLVTNCFDESGNGFEDPTIDVCVFRRGGTGTGTQVTTMVKFNKGWFMLGDSMDTARVNLFAHLQVGVWYEYWLIYCGDDDLMYNAILDESGMILDARSYPVDGSEFIVISQSGFVFGQSLEYFKMDYDGGVDEVRLYRCKPFGDPDFDTDFTAIQTFVGKH